MGQAGVGIKTLGTVRCLRKAAYSWLLLHAAGHVHDLPCLRKAACSWLLLPAAGREHRPCRHGMLLGPHYRPAAQQLQQHTWQLPDQHGRL